MNPNGQQQCKTSNSCPSASRSWPPMRLRSRRSSPRTVPHTTDLPDRMKPERPPLLTLDEALARLMGAVSPLPTSDEETLSTLDALGRVLRGSVLSTLDVPPQDNTSMDGYAT